CRMHCGTPLPQMPFLARCSSYMPCSNRLSAHEPSTAVDQCSHRVIALISYAQADEQNGSSNRHFANRELRHQHGEDSVVINAALTRVAQEQANANGRA